MDKVRLILDAVAPHVTRDPKTLARHFHRSLGLPPHEFIHSLRIEASKRLLLRTDFTVERVAARVGYSNTNHFRSVFRRHVGVLPGEYRDSHRD